MPRMEIPKIPRRPLRRRRNQRAAGGDNVGARRERRRVTAATEIARLKADLSRLRDIVGVRGDWIWESGPDHRFTWFIGGDLDQASPTDISPPAVIGKTRWELAGVDPECDEHWRQHKADLDARRPFRRFRYESIGASGKQLFLSVSGKPFFDDTGEFCGYRGLASNVTNTVSALQRAER